MIFKSHLISMLVYSIIISTLLACIKYDEKKDIIRYGVKLLIFMVCGVIVFSWLMYYL